MDQSAQSRPNFVKRVRITSSSTVAAEEKLEEMRKLVHDATASGL